MRAAIDYDGSDYEVIKILANREPWSCVNLITLLERNWTFRRRLTGNAAAGGCPQTFADITKARRLLGYDPQPKSKAESSSLLHGLGIALLKETIARARHESVDCVLGTPAIPVQVCLSLLNCILPGSPLVLE